MTSNKQDITQTENTANEAHLAAHAAFLRRASVPVFIVTLIITVYLLLEGDIIFGLSTFLIGALIAAIWRHTNTVPSEEEQPFFIDDNYWDLPLDDPSNPCGINNPMSPMSYQWRYRQWNDINSNLTPPTDTH